MNDRADGPFRLLFVCTGNTCRSPMAEVIANKRAADLGWTQFEARSAGVAAFEGSAASGGSVRAAATHGLDLDGHTSTLLTRDVADAADLILTMGPAHLMRVAELGAGERAALLTAFANGPGEGGVSGAIPDPIGGPDEEYLETYRTLDELIGRVMERIGPAVAP